MSAAETPAALLRRAAEHLRTLAAEATPGPWALRWTGQDLQVHGPGQEYPYSVAEWGYAVATWEPEASQQRAECDTGNADYLAAMHPGVGLALADWLDAAADMAQAYPELAHDHDRPACDDYACDVMGRAIETARTLLGEVAR